MDDMLSPPFATRSVNDQTSAPAGDARLEPIHGREASIEIRAAVEGAPAANHTADITWSTGAAVRRYSYMRDEPYDEVLSLDPKHVRLDRLNSGGAPLLNSHRAGNLSDQIGHVVAGTAKLGKSATATVRFSSRPDVQPIVQDVRDGIIKNVSVGYRVHKFERTPADPDKGTVAQYRAVDWEPMEISAVPIGADAEAGMRADAPANHCEIVDAVDATRAAAQTEEVDMNLRNATGGASAARAEDAATQAVTTDVTPPAVRAESAQPVIPVADVAADRVRSASISTLGMRAGVAADVIERAVSQGTTVEAFRSQLFDTLIERSGARSPTQTAHVTLDEGDKMRDAMVNAIEHRRNPRTIELTAAGREFRSMRLMELARFTLERRGVKTGHMGPLELADHATRAAPGMESSSDLGFVLGNIINRTLRQQYVSAPRTFLPWTRETTHNDFRPVTRVQVSGAPALLPVPEHAEYSYGVVTDGAEVYQLATYGRLIAFTRVALVNDDMDALIRIPQSFGQRAADLESDLVYAILGLNPAMADTNALFSSAHGNLAGTGTVLSVASLNTGRAAMRQQRSLEGEWINLVPHFLIVPSALEQLAWQLTRAAFMPNQIGQANPYGPEGGTPLIPIVEPRLDQYSTTGWYLVADPAQIDTIETAYLAGADRPYTEQRMGFGVDGIETKARHDFASKAIDWRGFYYNPGASS